MSNEGGAGACAPPPSYYEAIGQTYSYVDFAPACLKAGGFLKSPLFEKFDVVLQKANKWLASNPEWKVVSCESVKSVMQHWREKAKLVVDTSPSVYEVSDSFTTSYNMSLRFWICRKTSVDNPEPQHLGYLHVIPGICAPAGLFQRSTFQSFDQTIQNFNKILSRNPVNGKTINMETVSINHEHRSGAFDPDACFWSESGDSRNYFLNVVRLYYDETEGSTINKIGATDFVPAELEPRMVFSSRKVETFAAVMKRVNASITKKPPNVNICNVQSIDYKIKSSWSNSKVDTINSEFYQDNDSSTDYMRIIRVYWTQDSKGTKSAAPGPDVRQISYRTFMPVMVTKKIVGDNIYETQVQTMKRAAAWCNATGAKVLSGEVVKIKKGNEDPEVMETTQNNRVRQKFLLALRLYLDGVYRGSPPGVLPAPPEVQEECVIL